MATTDQSWRGLEEAHERLRWARKQKLDTGAAAAAWVGMKEGTYRAYERSPDSSKHTPLDYQTAVFLGRRFGVRWEWLLNGDGSPAIQNTPVDRIQRALEGKSAAQQEAIAMAVEALTRTGTDG